MSRSIMYTFAGIIAVFLVIGCGGGGGGGGDDKPAAFGVSKVYPENSGSGIPYQTVIATLNRDVAPETVMSNSLTVLDGAVPVEGTTTYNATTKSVEFVPDEALTPDSVYTAVLANSTIMDMSGNKLAADYQWSFSIVLPAFAGPPTLSASTVAPGGSVDVTIPIESGASYAYVHFLAHDLLFVDIPGVTASVPSEASNVTLTVPVPMDQDQGLYDISVQLIDSGFISDLMMDEYGACTLMYESTTSEDNLTLLRHVQNGGYYAFSDSGYPLVTLNVSTCGDGSCSPDDGENPTVCASDCSLCGGIAGLACDAGLTCIDIPDDGCDPYISGDCPGMCVH